MKKLLAAIILCAACLIGTNYHESAGDPLPPFLERMTCDEVNDFYKEAALLHNVTTERLKQITSPGSRKLWLEIRMLTISLHAPLVEARARKCRQA